MVKTGVLARLVLAQLRTNAREQHGNARAARQSETAWSRSRWRGGEDTTNVFHRRVRSIVPQKRDETPVLGDELTLDQGVQAEKWPYLALFGRIGYAVPGKCPSPRVFEAASRRQGRGAVEPEIRQCRQMRR
jgi:hypothetical protein